MTDYPKALAAAREAHTYVKHRGMTRAEAALGDLLAALDAQVPERGLRDSVLNSAKFRASCYALVKIVEGIEGLGRRWAANGERLKDTREWVAFYNCVAAMRNGTFNQANAEQAQQPAAADVTDEYARAFHDGWLACKRGDAEPPVPAPPAAVVPEGLTPRHWRVIDFALWRFINDAYDRATAAAQDKEGRWFKPGSHKSFFADAKDAEDARGIVMDHAAMLAADNKESTND